VDVTAFAKFGSVLDSVKARFGVLFSKEGVSGKGKNRDAEREQLKLFQRDGRAIVVVSFEDLERVAAGENFIAILRSKYEAVRLDLRPEARRCSSHLSGDINGHSPLERSMTGSRSRLPPGIPVGQQLRRAV